MTSPPLTEMAWPVIEAAASPQSQRTTSGRVARTARWSGVIPRVSRLAICELNAACAQRRVRVHYPELHLCTDNGAMIALAAGLRVQAGLADLGAPAGGYHFDVRPRWPLAELSVTP